MCMVTILIRYYYLYWYVYNGWKYKKYILYLSILNKWYSLYQLREFIEKHHGNSHKYRHKANQQNTPTQLHTPRIYLLARAMIYTKHESVHYLCARRQYVYMRFWWSRRFGKVLFVVPRTLAKSTLAPYWIVYGAFAWVAGRAADVLIGVGGFSFSVTKCPRFLSLWIYGRYI